VEAESRVRTMWLKMEGMSLQRMLERVTQYNHQQ